jgi:hydrogenase nickel incorporation protein HypA/HybF
MHEMSLTEGVVRIVEEQAARHGASRVKTVWLEIGELSSVEPDSMLFCFDAVARGNPLTEGAVLQILRVPGTAWCMDCSESVSIAQRFDPCPQCGGHHLTVTTGDEMRIKELEVE